MYALYVSAEGDCYMCVPPDPGIEAAALGASESTLPGIAPAKDLHTFTLDSGASHCFFRDNTTLTPLPAPVPIRMADPSRGPILARSSTVLPCPAVSTAALQDAMVTTTTPGGQRVSICMCTRTGRHLATFTNRPGSSLYTPTAEPPQVAASTQVSASGPIAALCSCRLLLHQTLLWHHRLGDPSLPRLRGMHSRLLVSGLPRSLPTLPPSPALPCLPCVEGRQCAAPHSSSFPPTIAPLQTLHMDVWGPARVSGQDRERYFLLVVDNYTRYTTVFPLRSKGEVPDVLIPWIRTVRLQLRERFCEDLLVLCLHSDRGGEFSSDLLREFCRGKGILQSFTLPTSLQQNGIAERRIGLVMEVARKSMIHAAAPHFLWPFAVRYTAHQLNLWPRVSLPETLPTLRWSGRVGDASVFRGLAPSGVSQVDPLPLAVLVEVTVDSGAARGAASGGAASEGAEPGGTEPEGAESGGAEPRPLSPQQLRKWFAQRTRVRSGSAGAGGSAFGGTGAGGARASSPGGAGVTAGAGGTGGTGAAGPGGARTRGSGTGDPGAGDPGTGGAGAGGARAGDPGAGGTGAGGARAGGTGGGGAGAGGTGARDPGAGGAGGGGAGAGHSPLPAPSPYDEQTDSLTERREPESRPASPDCIVCTGPRLPRPRPPPVPSNHIVAHRPSSVPLRVPLPSRPASSLLDVPDPESDLASPTVPHLLATVVTDPSSTTASALVAELVDFIAACRLDYATSLVAESESDCPPSVGGLTERREPESRPVSPVSRAASPVRTARACRVLRPCPPLVPGTHSMTLCSSTAPQRVPLPSPPVPSLPDGPDPESDSLRAASPTVTHFLATAVTNPLFESSAASALVAELVDFAAACRLDYATSLVAESASASVCPPSVGGECALGTDVLEDRQEEFECFAAAVPHLVAMLLAHEGDPYAPDIPNPRSYAEAITGPYSSQWQTAMDAEMAFWKSTGTYGDAVPLFGANIVDGMWIFIVKRPLGSPLVFK
ncbi:unnamed protein product [Closterium sp. NIES-54]